MKTTSSKKHILSKSTYIRSLQCLKSLYLYKFHFNLRDPLSPQLKARFDKGHEIGKMARQLFPGGVDMSPPTVFQYHTAVIKTKEMIDKGWPVLYEAAFRSNDVLVALDILVKKNNSWIAYEVKSSYAISETYLQDAALQYHIITESGLQLDDFRFVYLDRENLTDDETDLSNIFKNESVLESCITMQTQVSEQIERAKEIILHKMMPDIPVGEHCHKPYTCDFIGTCWKGVKPENV